MAILLGLIWPGIVQQFQVEPSQADKEEPYIAKNIDLGFEYYTGGEGYFGVAAFRKSVKGFTVNGNSNSSFEGAFYFPKQEVKFVGTSGVTFKCVQMVAWTVVFSGTSNVTNDCTGPGGGGTFAGQSVRLVE